MSKLQVTTNRTPSELATKLFKLSGAINEGTKHFDLVEISKFIKEYARHYNMDNIKALITEHSLHLFEGTDEASLIINEI